MPLNFNNRVHYSLQLVLPLPIDTINAYIDRVSIVMVNKIKDKFESQLS